MGEVMVYGVRVPDAGDPYLESYRADVDASGIYHWRVKFDAGRDWVSASAARPNLTATEAWARFAASARMQEVSLAKRLATCRRQIEAAEAQTAKIGGVDA